jgi:tetratricopeptide (TPR) repeat protein
MKKLTFTFIILPAFLLCLNNNVQSVTGQENPGEITQTERFSNADSAKTYLDSAKYFIRQEKISDAVRSYKKAAQIQPDLNEAYVGWFSLSAEMEDIEEGMMALNQWIKHNPENTQAWLYKAFAEAHLEHPEESLKAFDRLIELQPEEAGNYVGRGQMLYVLERYEEAIEAFDKSASLDSSRTDVIGMKTAAMARLGRFEEALVLINKILEQNPDDITGIYNRACLYSINGDKVNALADLRRAIELEPFTKEYARTDEDFKNLYEDEEFIELTK